MVEVSRIANYGYYPQATTFTSRTEAMKTPEDFKPGIYDPEQKEKSNKTKRNVLVVAGLAVAAGAVWFFTKGKGKNLINKLKGAVKGTTAAEATETAAKTVKKPKVKVKTRKATIAQHADLLPGEKVKLNKANGKEAMHKVRRNKKQIIEATRLREEAEAFTLKDLEKYQKSLGTPATAEELAFIEKNNKAATNTLGDIMEAQGIKRAKDGNRVVLAKEPKVTAPKVPVTPAATDKAAKIAELEAKIAKADAQIARYEGSPAMARYAKPHVTARERLARELAELQGNTPAVAPKAPVTPKATKAPTPITPEVKQAEIEKAWAEFANANKAPKAPAAPQVPTAADIWAKAEAEAARMAKEEAEVLKTI